MIKDRGNKKWVSLMLPEHKKLLGAFYQSHNDVKMPELDEQKIEELNGTILTAHHENKLVSLRYFKSNRYHDVVGFIKNCNPLTGVIVLISRDEGFSKGITIPIKSIIQVNII